MHVILAQIKFKMFQIPSKNEMDVFLKSLETPIAEENDF